MGMIIFCFILFYAEKRYKPRVEYIEESNMWIMHYNYKTTRKYIILIKL